MVTMDPAAPRNPVAAFDPAMFEGPGPDAAAIEAQAAALAASPAPAAEIEADRLARAIRLIDLTTLSGDDTAARVRCLCATARQPLPDRIRAAHRIDPGLRVAAVCVYPSMVPHAVAALEGSGIPVASVAAGFPTGLLPLDLRLAEIAWAVAAGASEIDVVIRRELALTDDWRTLHAEIAAMRAACGPAHLKVILATGELRSLANVRAASVVAMQAGADVIKTSTGKEAVNATLPVGLVMAGAIRDHAEATGYRVGLKPAGGLRTAGDALAWMTMVEATLGPDWLGPDLFRFGASSMLGDIEARLLDLMAPH